MALISAAPVLVHVLLILNHVGPPEMPLYMLTGRPIGRHKKYLREWNKRSKPDKGAIPQPFYAVEPPQEFDEPGKELSSDAQVWRTYVKEADQVDGELVDGWNRQVTSSIGRNVQIIIGRLDRPMLSSAALFSAISTAFVIESYKNLKQDPTDVSAQTLLIISHNIAAIANGSQPNSTEQAKEPPFTVPITAIFVNALWFLSLSLSVAVSLISMLAKEWCLAFMSARNGPPGAQARRRQQRWDGLVNWKMKELLMVLPSLIHMSLLLFAIGLCVFLWDVHFAVAIPVVFVTAAAASVYIGCTILPFIDDYCPYGTVLSRLYKHFMGLEPQANRADFKQDEVTVQALQWMVANCETPRSVDVAFQSLAGVNREIPWEMLQKWDVWGLMKQKLGPEVIDIEHQVPRTAAYSRALLSVISPNLDKNWRFKFGSNEETQRLEVLTMGVQSCINSTVVDKYHTLKNKTWQIPEDITKVGEDFLIQKGITQPAHQDGPLIEDPEQLSRDITQLLEQHLRGTINLSPSIYSSLCAALAFLLYSHLEAKPAVVGTHIITLLRVYFARKTYLEQCYNSRLTIVQGRRSRIWETFYRHSVQARELAFLMGTVSASQSPCHPSPEVSTTNYSLFEKAVESIWDSLIDMLHEGPDAYSDTVDKEWSSGSLHLLSNPGLYNWSPEDYSMIISFYNMFIPQKEEGRSSKGSRAISDVNLSRQYIQDITNYLATIFSTTVPVVDIPLLGFLRLFLVRVPPWTEPFIPTPEIYLFVIKNLCRPESPRALRACCQLMGAFPFPKATPRLIQLISSHRVINELATLLRSTDLISQAFAMTQLWLLFDMALHFEDRSDDTLSNLESILLEYDGLNNDLSRQESVSEHLSAQLLALLEQKYQEINETLAARESDEYEYTSGHRNQMITYFYRVYECILQRCYAPIPEFVSQELEELPSYLRGLSSSISLEDGIHIQG